MWTSPKNAKIIAEKIAFKLGELLPKQREYFEANLENFSGEVDEILQIFKIKIE
ncbi:MAG: metal ABC transporter substrate-binding protein [Candidatus Peribacteria bacterium]|nr:metal ABC transporter substrate-binding protein [Candidatus Peribacteria bacterium]